MMPVLTFCIFLPVFALMGRCFIQQTSEFIRETEGAIPTNLPLSSFLVLLFTVLASVVATRGLSLCLPWHVVLRDLILLGWCILLTQLDLARQWLPLRFTNSLIFSGLLFSLSPQSGKSTLMAVGDGLAMYGLLFLFRLWANRHGRERFGLGDVYLLTGLSVWLTLPVTAALALAALGLIMLQLLASTVGLLSRQQEIPFAPYLCLCLSVAILTQRFPLSTG
ncbi:prepilin peptidase (plasmid) [Erwinia tracheiphila]|uniref:Prepilin peptidase n=2 Tax=Erwinia tracheiphila TaxID=65700 RepID=A0A345CZX9_9GAMM|nr:prepilin peptidase [Erwinia tracheiphila]AXF78996.1 prepilin peptidase [Erwinia tracheiphila]